MVLLLLKRIGFMIFTMIVVSIILFLLLKTGLTGDPTTRVLGNFATDNLGTSTRYKGPVKDVLLPKLWNTAILGFWIFAIMIPLSLILGILSGMKEGSMLDQTISVFGILKTSLLLCQKGQLIKNLLKP
ncbi:MAG: hypothetical protein DRH26_08600 [Deltaproteobacteria bacterium]|nr:MAG: hypothetical protein DRH26_08600 [Deltaproteobacteria bacterium]